MMMPQDPLDLQLSSYDYHLPPELVADRPLFERDEARLLVYDRNDQSVTHSSFKELPNFLPPETLLVLNNSKVFPCRLLGHKKSGGKAEAFFLSLIPREINQQLAFKCLIKTSGKKRVGDEFIFGDLILTILEKEQDAFWASPQGLGPQEFVTYLEHQALIPIPPYIRDGLSDEQDRNDYQTVFARHLGSVAAPTAGLHFTPQLLQRLTDSGHQRAHVTLHVGAGTFAPVKSESILQHQMHAEEFFIEKEDWQKIQGASSSVVAVGTTSLRALESCLNEQGKWDYLPGTMRSTQIFLYPGKEIRSIQGLITNFHLPRSTLLMLVSALIGRKKTLELYELAVAKRYRFFSYGDAMLIV